MVDTKPSLADLEKAGISRTYASNIRTGKRTPSLKTALAIFDVTGARFGPLIGATKADIEAARRLSREAA